MYVHNSRYYVWELLKEEGCPHEGAQIQRTDFLFYRPSLAFRRCTKYALCGGICQATFLVKQIYIQGTHECLRQSSSRGLSFQGNSLTFFLRKQRGFAWLASAT